MGSVGLLFPVYIFAILEEGSIDQGAMVMNGKNERGEELRNTVAAHAYVYSSR
jgi:hypothetical protein